MWPWPPHVSDDIDAHAVAAAPREACGLVVRGPALAVWRGANQSPAPDAFALDPALLFRARRDGVEIVGIYHSHVGVASVPSAADRRAAALWPGVVHAIVRVDGARVTSRQAYRWVDGDLR